MTARRRLSQGELEVTVGAHERYVEGKAGGRRAVLKFLDLSGLDLSRRLLVQAFIGDAFVALADEAERERMMGIALAKLDKHL